MSNNYSDYRSNIKSGDLIVQGVLKRITFAQLFLRLVRFLTNSKYVHTATAWVIGDRIFVIEAILPKVVITPLSNYSNFYHLPLDIKWNEDCLSFLLDRVGHKYGVLDIIYMKLGIKKNNPDTTFCSELCAEFYMKTGYISMGNVSLSPKELIDMLMIESGNELIEVTTPLADT